MNLGKVKGSVHNLVLVSSHEGLLKRVVAVVDERVPLYPLSLLQLRLHHLGLSPIQQLRVVSASHWRLALTVVLAYVLLGDVERPVREVLLLQVLGGLRQSQFIGDPLVD